jgi:ADP-ribosylglycohydrolase
MLSVAERVRGCLEGVATGDAIGKQTETLSRADVTRWYPHGVRGFEGEPGSVIPRYAGNSKRQWRIGETTDDTERTVAVARAILAEGSVSHARVGREMLGCTKSVHPGVKSLWEFHQAADPDRIAVEHDGCGAAVRVSPVGILYASHRVDDLVSGAREASISTHGGSLAVAAAAATAAAVSAAIDGAPPERVSDAAERAALEAERRWPGDASVSMAAAIRGARTGLRQMSEHGPAAVAARCFPDRPLTIVPLALALVAIMRSAEEAILLAANVGGDSDSVASIAGGILGAMYPATISQEWSAVVETINHHHLAALADALSKQRC